MFNLTPPPGPPHQCYTTCTHNRPWRRAGRRRRWRAASIVYRQRLRRAAYITWFACGGDCLFGHRYRSSKDPLNDVWRSNHFFPLFTYAFYFAREHSHALARTRTHVTGRSHTADPDANLSHARDDCHTTTREKRHLTCTAYTRADGTVLRVRCAAVNDVQWRVYLCVWLRRGGVRVGGRLDDGLAWACAARGGRVPCADDGPLGRLTRWSG